MVLDGATRACEQPLAVEDHDVLACVGDSTFASPMSCATATSFTSSALGGCSAPEKLCARGIGGGRRVSCAVCARCAPFALHRPVEAAASPTAASSAPTCAATPSRAATPATCTPSRLRAPHHRRRRGIHTHRVGRHSKAPSIWRGARSRWRGALEAKVRSATTRGARHRLTSARTASHRQTAERCQGRSPSL
jgi:hypothetical protein